MYTITGNIENQIKLLVASYQAEKGNYWGPSLRPENREDPEDPESG